MSIELPHLQRGLAVVKCTCLTQLMTTSDDIIVPLSDIAFDIVGGLGIFLDYACARILIDGKPLVEMVRDYETKMLVGDKEADLAGLYWYLHPDSLIEYMEGSGRGDHYRIAVLGCTCLDEDCWPLVCSIEKQENHMIWYDFLQPHRRHWDYSDFGHFGFEKQQLLTELTGLKSAMSDLTKATRRKQQT